MSAVDDAVLAALRAGLPSSVTVHDGGGKSPADGPIPYVIYRAGVTDAGGYRLDSIATGHAHDFTLTCVALSAPSARGLRKASRAAVEGQLFAGERCRWQDGTRTVIEDNDARTVDDQVVHYAVDTYRVIA